jgi:hypothetical protein
MENIMKQFDSENYKMLNEDLQNLSEIQLKRHFVENFGNFSYKFEVPNDFDWVDYCILYKDVCEHITKEITLEKIIDTIDDPIWKLIEKTAKKHFTLHGYKEGRHLRNFDIKNIENKNIVIVSSKIYVSNHAWTYSNTRSIYSTRERYNQTKETILSIKKYIPDYFIVLFDNSEFSLQEFVELKSLTDIFINVQNDKELNYCTNIETNKLIPETCQLLKLYDYFFSKYPRFFENGPKNLFKISGRYVLNESFDYSLYENEFNIFKKNSDIQNINYYFTSFFKIGKKNIIDFFEAIKQMYYKKNKFIKMNFEEVLPLLLQYNFKEINNLGLTQRIAAWNEVSNI